MTAADILHDAVSRLTESGVPDPLRDAQLLLAEAAGMSRHRLPDIMQSPLTADAAARFSRAIAARAARQPVSQILGRRAFWKHDFIVTPDVLDPRPETETLIEAALADEFTDVLDLGTGSGAILISLLADRPQAKGLGTDISAAALAVARRNAENIGVRAAFVQSDWFSQVQGQFDLIVSNPPYIALAEMASLSPDVREWEPRLALTDEGDGLGAYRRIAAGTGAHLRPEGRLLVEIGPTQADDVAAIMTAAGFHAPRVLRDLDGRDRVIMLQNRPKMPKSA